MAQAERAPDRDTTCKIRPLNLIAPAGSQDLRPRVALSGFGDAGFERIIQICKWCRMGPYCDDPLAANFRPTTWSEMTLRPCQIAHCGANLTKRAAPSNVQVGSMQAIDVTGLAHDVAPTGEV